MNLKKIIAGGLVSLALATASDYVQAQTNLALSLTQEVAYTLSARDEKENLVLKLSKDELAERVSEEIDIVYNSFFVKIDEHYRSVIDANTFSTISFFASRTNKFLGRPSNRHAECLFYTNRIETIENGKTNVFPFSVEGTIQTKLGGPLILDPMSMYYFLMNSDITNLHNKSVLCSDGKMPWIYNFQVKEVGNKYHLTANTPHKRAAFNCLIDKNDESNKNRILEIKYKAGGVIRIKMSWMPKK